MALTKAQQRAAEMLAGMTEHRNATATDRAINPRDDRKREEAARAAGEVAGYRAALLATLPPITFDRVDREADRIVEARRAEMTRQALANGATFVVVSSRG